MLKHEKLPRTNSTESGAHNNVAKIQENKHTPELFFKILVAKKQMDMTSIKRKILSGRPKQWP